MIAVMLRRVCKATTVAGAEAGRREALNCRVAWPASNAPVGSPPGHRRDRTLKPNGSNGAALPQPPRFNRAARRPGRPPHVSRRGYSLVEALVVISINSVLMAVALTLLATLLKSERDGRQHFERTRSLVRLADDLRHDAATAERAESDPSEPTLRLQSPKDRTIEFTCDGDRIRRVEREGASIRHREAYHLARLSAATFTVASDKLVSVELLLNDQPKHPWRIDARLGTKQNHRQGTAP